METASTMVTSLWDQITIPQMIPLAISFGGALFALYRFWLSKKLEALKQNDEIALRYRQIEQEDRVKFQANIMQQMERMKQENIDLRQQLYNSEKEKIGLMQQVAQLQAEVIGLREEVKRMTARMSEGEAPHAAHG
jgi:chromosome segregation ATPase